MMPIAALELMWTGSSWKLTRRYSDGHETLAYYSQYDEEQAQEAIERRLDTTDPGWRDTCGEAYDPVLDD